MKHVIIGAGAAGIAAARTIRRLDKTAEITVISADDAVYSRCMLDKFIGGARDVAEIGFVPPDFFEANRIEWSGGVAVDSVDTAAKRVFCGNKAVSYDRLLVATGAKSAFPPIDGLESVSRVYGLRDLSDAVAIRKKAADAEHKHVVIIGAGLVGLDAAYGLVQMGIKSKPLLIDSAAEVLSACFDETAAKAYRAKFEENGCQFRLNSRVEKICGNSTGDVMSVVLDCGDELPCDLLIVATGVRPENALLPNAAVNQYLATQYDGVYIAGDATGLSESWPAAVEQGEVAAHNMCGIQTAYDAVLMQKNTAHFFGIASMSVGEVTPKAGDTIEARQDRGRYQKVILRGGVPVGVLLQGDISRGGFWQQLIANKVNIAALSDSVWKTSFADGYALDESGEYVWQLPAM